MQIRSLELNDVRKFQHQRFDFQPGFNLIVGENGAGKSTALRSLATTLGVVKNLKASDRLSDDDIRHHGDEFEVQLEFQVGETPGITIIKRRWHQKTIRRGRIPKGIPAIWFGANESTTEALKGPRIRRYRAHQSGKYRDREAFRYREAFLYYEKYMEPEYEEEKESAFGRSDVVRRFVGEVLASFSSKFHRFGWSFTPYDCSVIIPGTLFPDARQATKFCRAAQAEIMRFFDFDFPRRRYRPWANRRLIKFSGEGRPHNEKDYVRPMPEFGEILRRVEREFKIESEIEKIKIELKLGPRITVVGPDGPFFLSELSDGEKRIFSMIVDIARQLSLVRGGLRELETTAGIVVIDEIDCHLHPKWQRMIVPTLERLFPACQFIATTHSPFVIQATAPGKLFRIDGTPPEADAYSDQSLEDIVEDVQGISMPQRSKRAEDMSKAAERYFRLLRRAKKASPVELQEAEIEYRKASEPFANEPALNALLRVEAYTTQTK